MFAIRKTSRHGAVRLVTTDRAMLKPKQYKTAAGAQRWIDGEFGQAYTRNGWTLEVVVYHSGRYAGELALA